MRIARRVGAKLTTQTLWDQLYALSMVVAPFCERLKEHILAQPVIGADESPFKLVKKGGSVKWQAWEISCPTAIYFAILSAKSALVGSELLGDYGGTVVVDGAAVYTALARAGPFSLAGCWSHARRKVLKAEGEAPAQVDAFLDLVGELYAIERKAVPQCIDPHAAGGYRRHQDLEVLGRLRDTESRAAVQGLQEWILAQRCIPGGLLKSGLKYVSKRWTALTRFLDDPRIPLDNNQTEGGYINMAIGRRNYIGARSTRGTEVAAAFYSIFESAKINGHDPEAYLRYIVTAAAAGEVPLLPHCWQK